MADLGWSQGRIGVPDGAQRAVPEHGVPTLVLSGRIAADDVPALSDLMQEMLADAPPDVLCDVGGLTDPDLVAVDALARLQLTAHRMGCRLRLSRLAPEARDLVLLAGLDVVLLES